MKKKVLALLLAAVMALGVTACGGTTTSGSTGTSASQTDTQGERPVVRVYIKWAESQLPNWPALIEEYNADESNPVIIEAQYFGSMTTK